MDKQRIIAEIQRTAADNGGVALGQLRFEKETGIARDAWRGRYWGTWSEAVDEAGLAPNRTQDAHSRDALILSLVTLTKKRGKFPTYADLRMAKRNDPSFPTHHA